MNSNLKIIEIEARSIDEAKEKLQSHLTEGLTIISEEILSGEKTETIQESEDTTEDAFAKALAKVPAQATVETKKVIGEPERKSFQIQAENDQDAITKIPIKYKYAIDSVSLRTKGRKGFLGIGKILNTYDVSVFEKAVVSVSYREKVKIRVKVGTYLDKIKEHLSNVKDFDHNEVVSYGNEIMPILVTWLSEESARLRKNAAGALEALGWKPTNEQEEISFLLAINGKGKASQLSQMSDEAMNLCYEAAKSEKSWLSKSAIELLCNTVDSRAGEVLKKLLLPGQNKSVRQAIFSKFTPSYVYADPPLPLGRQGCTELAIKYLNDPEISYSAMAYLARYPSTDALPGIIDIIKNSNRGVPTELVTMLGQSIGGRNDYKTKGTLANDIYNCLKILASKGDSEAKACLELTERNLW